MMGAVLVILAQGLPASSPGAFTLSSPFLALLLLPFFWQRLSGSTFGKLFGLVSWVLSVLGTVFLSSRFLRKDAMYFYWRFIQSWSNLYDTVHAGTGI